jgi:hypothetical protein
MSQIKIGSIVSLRGRKATAKVVAFYWDIHGGVRLDKPLAGFYSWNIDDLELRGKP